MEIVVYFRNGKILTIIDTTKPNVYLPLGKWTADDVDEVCHNWSRNGFVVSLR
jgi:hypothetical protein